MLCEWLDEHIDPIVAAWWALIFCGFLMGVALGYAIGIS